MLINFYLLESRFLKVFFDKIRIEVSCVLPPTFNFPFNRIKWKIYRSKSHGNHLSRIFYWYNKNFKNSHLDDGGINYESAGLMGTKIDFISNFFVPFVENVIFSAFLKGYYSILPFSENDFLINDHGLTIFVRR